MYKRQVHACTKVNLRGKRVAIVGCGTIGLFAVAIARALGAQTIIGIEPVAAHAAMAKKLGADHVLSPGNTGPNDYAHDRELVSEVRRPVSYTHLRAHETVLDLVCRLLLEKKNNTQ